MSHNWVDQNRLLVEYSPPSLDWLSTTVPPHANLVTGACVMLLAMHQQPSRAADKPRELGPHVVQ